MAKTFFCVSSILCLGAWIIIGASVFWAGYVPSYDESLDWAPAQCTVESYENVPATCSYYYNCTTTCARKREGGEGGGGHAGGEGEGEGGHEGGDGVGTSYHSPGVHGSCTTSCETGTYPCFNNSINFGFNPDGSIVSNTSFQNINVVFPNTNTTGWTDPLYVVGSSVDCYYDICPLTPLSSDAISNCEHTRHTNITTNVSLVPITANQDQYRTSIASIILIGLFFFSAIIFGVLRYCKNKSISFLNTQVQSQMQTGWQPPDQPIGMTSMAPYVPQTAYDQQVSYAPPVQTVYEPYAPTGESGFA